MTRWERFSQTGPLMTVSCAGLAGAIGQILILRELLVLFYGNELSSGLFFSCWLVWTAVGCGAAGFWLRIKKLSPATPSPMLILSGLALPSVLLFVRASRLLWSLPMGEMVSLPLMAVISFFATFPLCVTLGTLFSVAWSSYTIHAATDAHGGPIRVYICEALGAAVGGGVFYFLLLPNVHPFRIALAVSGILIAAAGVIIFLSILAGRRSAVMAAVWCVAVSLLLAAALNMNSLDAASRRWQWGDRIVTVQDTPYHNLALLEEAGFYSLFGNGLWYFSAPDLQYAEFASHLALLQQPRPRTVLLIGGGVAGLITEIFKHPEVTSLDYIEPDPELIVLARRYFPNELTTALTDPRVRVIHQDAGSFLKRAGDVYDVILLNVGEPMNVELNRFYTVEFFRTVKTHLAPDGVFSFALPVAPDMVGPTQGSLLKSLNITLKAIFADVHIVMGGEGARFLVSPYENGLETDPRELTRRVRARGMSLNYLTDAGLHDLFSPFRAQYVESVLVEGGSVPPNEDFRPVCALQSLLVWSAQIHPRLQTILLAMTSMGTGWLWGGIAALLGLLAPVFWAARKPWARGPGVGLSVIVVGGSQIVLQLSLLLGFQILEGFVYMELALIVSSFMVGIALGSALFDHCAPRIERPRVWLALVQLLFMAHLAGSVLLLFLFHSDHATTEGLSLVYVFPTLALVAGALGGLHFSLAVRTLSGEGGAVPGPWLGGGLYALDLLGASAGALTASLILFPVYGLITTCLVALALLWGSLGLLVLV
jgi:spermidine synthase